MTITRVGTNKKYAEGWEKAFGGPTKKSKTTKKKSATAKKSTKKKAKAAKKTKKKAKKS